MISTIVLIAVGIHVKDFLGYFIPTLLYLTHPFQKSWGQLYKNVYTLRGCKNKILKCQFYF